MYAPERHQQILGRARAEGRVDVTSLARELDVTPETIRRDLTALERHGLLRRVHGGAIASNAPSAPQIATTNIGVVVPSTVGHFPIIVRGMQAASTALRTRLVLATSQYRTDVERRQAERLVEARRRPASTRAFVNVGTTRGMTCTADARTAESTQNA